MNGRDNNGKLTGKKAHNFEVVVVNLPEVYDPYYCDGGNGGAGEGVDDDGSNITDIDIAEYLKHFKLNNILYLSVNDLKTKDFLVSLYKDLLPPILPCQPSSTKNLSNAEDDILPQPLLLITNSDSTINSKTGMIDILSYGDSALMRWMVNRKADVVEVKNDGNVDVYDGRVSGGNNREEKEEKKKTVIGGVALDLPF